MNTHHYPSNLTDEQWAIIEPLLPPDLGGGRPRTTSMRDVLDAIFYILRTGCRWRCLPGDLPPKSTVWRYFADWRRDGTLDKVHDALRKETRTMERPYQQRTSASADSQSVDAPGGGEQRGRDNHKNVGGRKRHIVVDSMGSLLAVLVTAADVDDGVAAKELFARLGGRPMSKVKPMYADTKYHNYSLYEWVEANAAWELEIIRRPAGETGWVKLPVLWRWADALVSVNMTELSLVFGYICGPNHQVNDHACFSEHLRWSSCDGRHPARGPNPKRRRNQRLTNVLLHLQSTG